MKFILILLAMFLAFPAQAAMRIGNCDCEAHTVTVDYYGEKMELQLEPGQHRRIYGRAREISLGEQTIFLIRHNNEYCIRKGKITLQRRKRDNRGAF